MNHNFDAIVIGAGHAGCEAGLALARLGNKILLLVLNLDSIGFLRQSFHWMDCKMTSCV